MNKNIIACGKTVSIKTPVVLWNDHSGYICPNKRGRSGCSSHNPELDEGPTRPESSYIISNPSSAYKDLTPNVTQCVLHYDACYCSDHCHQVLSSSESLGSHFYLDLDGTIYQTCDLYWRTNAAPSDDGLGNHRAVHIEMANLSWEARADEAELFDIAEDQYVTVNGRWQLSLPKKYQGKIRTQDFIARPARADGENGYFSKSINGKMVRMWDFTEEQYQALIKLCMGINRLLPRIELNVPFDPETNQTPLNRIKNFSTFRGFLGHAHVQSGKGSKAKAKYDPGSAMDWDRLRKAFEKYSPSI